MVESRQKVTKPELYERLIDRLGMALDAAKTADRLRDERPLELELRGLSPAEFDLVKAYLDRSERETHGCLSEAVKQLDAPRSAKIIWLKDKAPGKDTVKVRSLQFK
ncbi:hypothetical protein SAMN04490185_0305 [Pseudomonas frederiksbergensis]|jgi:hypothetical protein|uniref:Uncharacterized protein n=1 Tax=Pseudomonas frederiksbergensis TaxID=104087 RepID=A0A1H4MIP0_9PSED|nr:MULTISPECIES: hypothetical protein [Pseudomonas]PMU09881.1 hypothetical protein C1Y11_14700 [Pseudomonas sp. FW305-20]PMU17054.1 hypothetical protein C1Y10_17400 [Pseudomonas sp. FW305-122]PMU35054.1 hypothetical protein C1Y12_26165 [Pseudomonas sp. FW305-47B]PMX57001.1 hypothetical protein C1Y13_25750 [Pseudomonas sp. FW305-33]PMX70538.1 hypothetical protein C1X12_04910 [Pseudomonas sp. FW305-60]